MKYNEQEIVEKYNNGQNTLSLAKELKTYNTTIRRILLRNNVKIRSYSEAQRRVKYNPFSLEKSQYWLGLLATDGCITNGKVILDLHERDKDILDKYIEHSQAPVNLNRQRSKTFGTSNQLRAEFTNKETVDFLIRWGITPRKSKTLKINFPMTWDFIRGVIDGDGCISLTNKGKGIRISITTSSAEFFTQLKDFFKANDIHVTKHVKENQLYMIMIDSKEDVLKCYYNLYNSDGPFMKRKQQKFGSVIQK